MKPRGPIVGDRASADQEVLDRLAARGVLQRGVGKPGRGPRMKPRPGSRRVSDRVVDDRG
jgi:hypothetical protein